MWVSLEDHLESGSKNTNDSVQSTPLWMNMSKLATKLTGTMLKSWTKNLLGSEEVLIKDKEERFEQGPVAA